ncbi:MULTISPECIES: NAD-dependent epimerase/dehydratase family protein [unclassified Arthrobacter]|uniref:NAD-dependent epimerase/dehydratase family protein n=1 Tax=unclassified Arthrobacter TaxID=235627 RepID=UPI001E3300C7|nr:MULTISPECIES: NAD-dependent epimerase/dehydratase family protein [unclassified Arthrobacter]MCC9145985.1 NAD-dependent epimerase/dehydratase family protein [Arthrobacter sp. zg-Y919]MDK1277214.1 NAD-dependent epimerase/dehydratase family protein [Arthrobacter sp. zg.Y919]WIB03728.1 NAD-dependent epimerase/dehydratase family protein [Arthrobacter sp. zg-Y919]
MTVLIAGCGDLGTEAGLRFAAAGFSVLGWRRSPEKLPAQITGSAVDLTAGNLPHIPADTDVVVIAVAADQRTEEAYRAAYLTGTANVLDALERDGVQPRRILFVSSTAVYGDADGGEVDEETPAAPASATGAVILEAEQLLHTRRPDAVVLRLSGIYGPGRTRLIDSVTAGTAVVPARTQLTNRIHRDDAAAAIVHLTTRVSSPAPLYVGVDMEPVELADVLGFLAAELGRQLPPASETSTSRGGNRRLSNRRLRGTGFEFAYPTYREGYRAVLAGAGVRHP